MSVERKQYRRARHITSAPIGWFAVYITEGWAWEKPLAFWATGDEITEYGHHKERRSTCWGVATAWEGFLDVCEDDHGFFGYRRADVDPDLRSWLRKHGQSAVLVIGVDKEAERLE